MKCQLCSAPATVHLTHIEPGGQKKELHLCDGCAEKKQVITQKELNLPAILQTLIGTQVGAVSEELARLVCPMCGIKYMEFRSEGRLGCPHDYEVFRSGLQPLLVRIHRAEQHRGKAPRSHARSAHWQRELLELRRQLREAVDAELYERAAELRDFIRQKESQR